VLSEHVEEAELDVALHERWAEGSGPVATVPDVPDVPDEPAAVAAVPAGPVV
jgi:hypothetical protein